MSNNHPASFKDNLIVRNNTTISDENDYEDNTTNTKINNECKDDPRLVIVIDDHDNCDDTDDRILRQLHKYDVICGRNSIARNHIGNVYFRKLIVNNCYRYRNTVTRYQESQIINNIITTITKQHNGRFFVLPDSDHHSSAQLYNDNDNNTAVASLDALRASRSSKRSKKYEMEKEKDHHDNDHQKSPSFQPLIRPVLADDFWYQNHLAILRKDMATLNIPSPPPSLLTSCNMDYYTPTTMSLSSPYSFMLQQNQQQNFLLQSQKEEATKNIYNTHQYQLYNNNKNKLFDEDDDEDDDDDYVDDDGDNDDDDEEDDFITTNGRHQCSKFDQMMTTTKTLLPMEYWNDGNLNNNSKEWQVPPVRLPMLQPKLNSFHDTMSGSYRYHDYVSFDSGGRDNCCCCNYRHYCERTTLSMCDINKPMTQLNDQQHYYSPNNNHKKCNNNKSRTATPALVSQEYYQNNIMSFNQHDMEYLASKLPFQQPKPNNDEKGEHVLQQQAKRPPFHHDCQKDEQNQEENRVLFIWYKSQDDNYDGTDNHHRNLGRMGKINLPSTLTATTMASTVTPRDVSRLQKSLLCVDCCRDYDLQGDNEDNKDSNDGDSNHDCDNFIKDESLKINNRAKTASYNQSLAATAAFDYPVGADDKYFLHGDNISNCLPCHYDIDTDNCSNISDWSLNSLHDDIDDDNHQNPKDNVDDDFMTSV